MIPSKLTALFVLTLLLATSISATTYYLDFSGGSNANNGTSELTAWKDIAQIANNGVMPGDEFLFKRGEVWEISQWYFTLSGSAVAPVTFGAYGGAEDELPIITNLRDIADADNPANWTESTTNIWTFSLAGTPGRLFLDGSEYLRASTLADVGATDSEGSLAYWFFSGGLLYLSATQNPATLYSDFRGSSTFYATLLYDNEYLVFENIDFRGGTGSSLAVFGGSNLEFRNCAFGHSANSGILLLNTTVGGMDQSTTNITIENNLFDSNFTFYYGLGSERGCGDGLRLRNGVNNCTIANNVFRNWAHNAVELLGDDAAAEGVNSNLIYDNQIAAPDIPYAHPFGADGLMGKCQNNEFYRNSIENCRTASQINGNNNWVHHNIITGMRRSPSKEQATAHAFVLGIYGAGLVCADNRFDHNLIIDTDESAFLVRGYGFAGQVAGNAIRNNIIYETGKAPYAGAYQSGTGLVIYDTETDGVGGNSYQHNLFYSSLTFDPVYIQDDNAYLTTTAFNALNGTDGNTIIDNDTGDPLFTDLAGGDYLPMDNSPAVNAGIDVGLTLDFALQDRLVGPAPDIGPLETDVLTPLPVEWGRFWLEKAQSEVMVYWETLNEVNADFFGIERSEDGVTFSEIGRVKAVGFSSEVKRYWFSDRQAPAGNIYYRLRQVDVDGAHEYSEIRNIAVLARPEIKIIRPDRETLQIIGMNRQDEDRLHLQIFDQSGRKCLESVGSNRIAIGSLPPATYLLVLRAAGRLETLLFVK